MRVAVSVSAVLLASSGLFGACGKTETVSDVLPIKSTEVHKDRLSITVVNTYGSVLLKGGRGLPTKMGGRLLRKARARGKKAAKKLLGQLTVVSSGAEKERKFVVAGPKGHHEDLSADLELDVPVDSDVTVQTAKGGVRIFGVHGRVQVDVDRGKVELRGMQGKVLVSAKEGEIFVSGRIQGAQITTGKGLVQVQWLSGMPEEDSTVRTADGDLKLMVHKLFKASVRMVYGRSLHVGGLDVQKTGKGKARLDLGQGGKLLVLAAPKGNLHFVQLSIVPPKPIRLKGPPPIRGGGLIKRPRNAADVQRLRERDRRDFEQREKKARGTSPAPLRKSPARSSRDKAPSRLGGPKSRTAR